MKYILNNIIFSSRDLLKGISKVMLSGFGIIFLISFLIIFISLRKSVSEFIEKRIFGQLNINEIQITPGTKNDYVSFNLFTPSANEISDKTVSEIKTIPGIKTVYPVMRLNIPSMLTMGMFGKFMRADILTSSVDKNFFRESKIEWKKFRDGENIPVIIPYFALDLYNNFAAVNGLPELGEKSLIGFTMKLSLGSSSFSPSKNSKDYNAVIFGFTSRISSTGIIVPDDFLKRVCRERQDKSGASGCGSCVMIMASAAGSRELPSVVNAIKKMKLNVASRKDIAEKAARALGIIDGAFLLILSIILVLTVIAIFNSYMANVYNRSQEISLKRVIGASKLRIIGVLFGVTGYFTGYLALKSLSDKIPEWIPLLKGLNLSADVGYLLPVSVAVSAAVSSVSALIPAVFASNMNLFKSSKA
jgi:hypothetical protein